MHIRMFSRGLVAALVLTVAACSNPEAEKKQYFDSGMKFAAEKKYQEAIVQFRNAVRVDNKFGEAHFQLAEAFTALGDGRNAARQYIAAADLLPDNPEAQLKAATVLALSGRFEDARTRVQRVLDKDARNVQAQILLGNILAGQKDMAGAVEQVEEAIQIDPTRGLSYTNLGVLRMAQGDRDAARAAFDKAVELDPKSLAARLSQAMFQLQIGEIAAAETTLKAALELDPKHALANRAMAALYLGSKRAPEAEPYLKAFSEVSTNSDARFALADYYTGMRRLDEAKAVLTKLAGERATADNAEWRLARIEYGTDRAVAHARIDRLLTKSPSNVQALVMKASWLLVEGKRTEALDKAQAAVKAAPELPSAHYLVGVIHTQMQDVPSAIAAFNEVLRLNPRAAAAQLQVARLQLAQGAASEAVRFAESVVKSAPANPIARLTLAGGLLAQRDLARAEPMIAELLKEYPKAADVHALDGLRHLLKKNPAGARAAYGRALQLDARSHPAIAGLVALDLLEKKPDASLKRVEARLSESPDDVRLLQLVSRVYLAMNDQAKAERALRRAIDVAPGDSSSYAMLGQLYLAQQKLVEARVEFDQVAKRNPKNVGASTVAAMLSHQTNDVEDAKRRYRDILDREPNAPVAANNLAWILADEGTNLDDALRLAQRAEAQAPNRAEILDTLGWVYYRKDQPALAVPAFEKSIKLAPDNAVYHYHLGLAHSKGGNVQEARHAVERALKLNPNYADALKLQATLR
jgi:tetratricopeptide (TPR) repeat protein